MPEHLSNASRPRTNRWSGASGAPTCTTWTKCGKILEVAIAEKAAERRTAHDAAVLEKHLTERGATAAAGALQACIEADVNFHIALAEATHNEILCELYRSTAVHLKKRFSNIYRDTECLLATQPTHGQLLGYILAGDVRNAREAITRILEEP